MMDLVKSEPKAVDVANAMPPIENEGAEQPAGESFRDWEVQRSKFEDRVGAERLLPQIHGRERYDQLNQVDDQRPQVPALHRRKLAAWEQALKDEEHQG